MLVQLVLARFADEERPSRAYGQMSSPRAGFYHESKVAREYGLPKLGGAPDRIPRARSDLGDAPDFDAVGPQPVGSESGLRPRPWAGTRSSMELTIGELASAAGVPVSTVRYYERKGLLRPTSRSTANYRLYSRAELERLRFVRAAQASGFSLKDVAQLLRPASCERVQRLIENRLERIEEQARELRRVPRVLRHAEYELGRPQIGEAGADGGVGAVRPSVPNDRPQDPRWSASGQSRGTPSGP